MATKPVILFVHDCWYTERHFEPVRSAFANAGYLSECPLRPSYASPVTLEIDVQYTRLAMLRLVETEGRDVIVVAHGYGRMVATEAVDAFFAKKHRVREGKQGGVLNIIYMCAFVLPVGADPKFYWALGGPSQPTVQIAKNSMCRLKDSKQHLYHDLEPEEQDHWATQTNVSSHHVCTTSNTKAAYLHHPVTYLHCTKDRIVGIEIQQMMVKILRKHAGVDWKIYSCDAGHSPFLSMPEVVLTTVDKVWTEGLMQDLDEMEVGGTTMPSIEV